MIARNERPECRQAGEYFYDYLFHADDMPDGIRAHIHECSRCQAEIAELRTSLSESEPKTSELQGVTRNLEMQFRFLGEPVSCGTVRLFLAAQADPQLAIRTPTPITAHLVECYRCREDLHRIQDLNLSHEHLCVLGQILAADPELKTSPASCAQSIRYIEQVVRRMSFEEVPREVLQHLCACPECRALVYAEREEHIGGLSGLRLYTAADEGCKTVDLDELFDYCFPWAIDPANDQYARFRPAFTQHVSQCPNCLARMQRVHRQVAALAEEHDDVLVTRAVLRDADKEDEAGLPILVEVIREPTASPSTAETAPESPEPVAVRRHRAWRRRLAPIVAAAAILIVGYAVVTNMAPARAFDPGDVYRAADQVSNLHVAVWNPAETAVKQEVLISEDLHARARRQGDDVIYWDLDDAVQRRFRVGNEPKVSEPLTRAMAANVADALAISSFAMPFVRAAGIPQAAEWKEVTAEEPSNDDTRIFEMQWSEGPVSRRWRGYFADEGQLPTRTELWERLRGGEYELVSVQTLEILEESRVRELLSEWGVNSP